MRYCTECGSPLNEGRSFCTQCGIENAPEQTEPKQKEQLRTLRAASNKTRKWVITGAIGVLLLGGGFLAARQMYSPEKTAQHFIEAVKNNDKEKVKQYLNDGNNEVSVNNAEAGTFIKYMKDHPKQMKLMEDTLNNESKAFSSDDIAVSAHSKKASAIHLKGEGKHWLLFPAYSIGVKPYYISITSDFKNAEVFVNNQKQGKMTDDEKSFGPFLPGQYTVKGVFHSKFGTFEKEWKADSAQSNKIDFELSGQYVSVSTNDEDASLFINGKDTGMKMSEVDEVGPIALDGSVTMFAQQKRDGYLRKSEEVTVDEDTSEVDLNFDPYESDSDYSGSEDENYADGEAGVEDAIRSHYAKISQNDYEGAYDKFSSARKSKVTLSGWSKGLKENYRDDVTYLSVNSTDGDTATAYVEMTSYDKMKNGHTLIQKWGGEWDLVYEDGEWKLDQAHLEKRDSNVQ